MKSFLITIFGLGVFAWIIVFMSGEFSYRNQNYKSVLLVMAVIAIALPILAFIVNG
jgi:hypothetical protein